jgi:hypothetical protein
VYLNVKCSEYSDRQYCSYAIVDEMFARRIDLEMEMHCKEILQSFALSAKAEKVAKGISERKGKVV